MAGLADSRAGRTASPGLGDIVIEHLVKRYGGAVALQDVSLTIHAGTVHALVGENGAGKSTLGRILAGVTQADEGRISIAGQEVHFRSPREALAHGVATIAQELALVPHLTVAENVLLGAEPAHAGWIGRAALRREFNELAASVGYRLPADALAGSLGVADQQKVEILRALYRRASLIIMDEPTAALTGSEAASLRAVLRRLADGGQTVVLISHFLSEVLEVSDTITTLRDGRLVSTVPASEATEASLIQGMLGRALDSAYPPKGEASDDAAVVLEVEDLHAPGVHGVSLTLRAGEILGIAGLVGSGRSELARAIYQDTRATRGTVRMSGRTLRARNPRTAIEHGIALIPESRKELGLQFLMSIRANATIASMPRLSRWSWVRASRERAEARRELDASGVRMSGAEARIGSLSGGNQQKVLFSRAFMTKPRVLIADEPTRGVDVGSKRTIYDLLCARAAEGAGIIVISSELDEVLGLAHRVLVMRHGRIVTELRGEHMHQEAVLEAAFDETTRSKG